MQACDRCHARKTRCDRRIPQCSACEKAGTSCLHADKLRQRNMPRGYLDGMESMVRDLTAENAKLRRQLHRASRSSQAPDLDSVHNDATLAGTTAGATPSTTNSLQTPKGIEDGASSLHSTPVDSIFALEVGYLSLVATGETRYLGSGSGMNLASMISSAISTQIRMSLPEEQPVSDRPSHSSVPTAPTDWHRPSLANAKPLIEAYFQHTHITFPLLHKSSFMATVQKMYEESGFYECHPYEVFVFYMVLAIGSSNFNKLGEPTTGASAYYAKAQSKVHLVMAMDGLTVLKAILLVSQHGIFSNLRDTSVSIWHLVGIGARLCFEQGLHLQQKHMIDGACHRSDKVAFAEEMKKRCFWCLYNLDRIVAITLGRPLAIRDEDIDVSLPSHLEDEQFSVDHPIELSNSSGDSPQLSPFLHLIRIRRLSGQILNTLYNHRHGHAISMEEKREVRMRFHLELVAWKADTKHLNLTQSRPNQAYVSGFWTDDWYNAVYNNAMLLLYRPSPYLPHPAMTPGRNNEDPELMTLLVAAKASIESYSALRSMRRLNYSWITLHGVFIAGLAYIYSVGRTLREPAHRISTPDTLSIVEVTRGCSNVLVAICERWNVSRRSCDLFDKLSNAVILDSLNATSGSQYNGQNHAGNGPIMDPMHNASNSQCLSSKENTDPKPTPLLDQIFATEELSQYTSTFDFTNQGEHSLPSELRSGFSYDWSFETPFDDQGVFDTLLQNDAAEERTDWLGGA